MEFHLNLRQLVHALSDALDMVGVDDRHHGKRVAFMARQCACELGLGAAERDALFVAALLHDCGVSSTQVHLNLVNEMDWSGAQDHCHTGYRLLAGCEPFTELAEVVDQIIDDWTQAGRVQVFAFEALKAVASLFSACVDAKSRFTAEHSHGVASLARHIGGRFGLPIHTLNKLELAGLLHDIGKLRVPDEILEKPACLDEDEFTLMERHSFDTLNVLGRIKGLEDIAHWASQHHEDLLGSGYPFKKAGDSLSLEARILKVADVFQALAQNRPYRHGLAAAQIHAILQELVAQGRLDARVVEVVAADLAGCWKASLHAGFDGNSHAASDVESSAAQLH